MAVLFDAHADRLATSSPVGSANFTITGWFYLTGASVTYQTIWSLDNGAGGYITLETEDGSNSLAIWDQGNNQTEVLSGALTVGTWYYSAVTVSGGTTGTLYLAAAGDATPTSFTGNALTAITATNFTIGSNLAFTDEFMVGRLAYLKVYSAVLTAAEIHNEMQQAAPIRTANLHAFYPLLNTAEKLVDFSGGARNTSNPGGSGSWTTEDGPPIPWHRRTKTMVKGATIGASTVSASSITRIHDLEGTLTLTSVGGGAGGAANTDIFIQATQSAGRRQSAVTLNGFLLDDGGSNDLSAASVHVGAWFWVTHYASLTDLRFRIASNSGTANYDEHIVPLTEYPALGGWHRVWVDISRTPDATGGTALDEATARHFGPIVSLPTVGGNAANVILDAIDQTTTGLSITGGTSVWNDFVTFDQGTTNNKYGVISSSSGVLYCRARLTLGTSSPNVFSDTGFVIVFPQQNLVESTFMGITCSLASADTNITWTRGVLQSPGTVKGDLIITGTSGTFTATGCIFTGLRAITLTSRAGLYGCTVNTTGLLTQAGGVLSSCTFNSLTGSSNILATDPGQIYNCTFNSDGTGHAIEISTPGTYTFTGNSFSGYATVNGSTGNEMIYNNSGGAVTLNIVNGTTPSIRNGASASTTVNTAVPVTVTVVDKNDVAIQSAQVAVYVGTTQVFNTDTDSSGVASGTWTGVLPSNAIYKVRKSSTGATKYISTSGPGIISTTGMSVKVVLQVDPNVT